MKKVNILMCTYNGEKYLREQIDSIIDQTYENISLFIRDDGSNDNTLGIIHEYTDRFPEKVQFLDSEKHLGYPGCFWDILAKCPPADYYAFSDQDDIWDVRKIEYAVDKLTDFESNLTNKKGIDIEGEKKQQKIGKDGNIPLLYIHDSTICDKDGNAIGEHRLSSFGEINYNNIIFYNIAEGFSMVINNPMRDVLLGGDSFSRTIPHDQWTIWTAFFRGNIVYDSKLLAKYRRHEDTVTITGGGRTSLIKSWIQNEIFGTWFHSLCTRILYLTEYNKEYMTDKQYNDLRMLAGDNSCGNYIKRLFYAKRLRPSIGGELALRINFLLGKK